MPIKIPNDLPAVKILAEENIFAMTETRAMTQDIRPLQILLLNLMPKKIETETQISRILGNTPLQIDLTLIRTQSHVSHNTSQDHLLAFYKTFDEVKDRNFDGLIITGAPVELMEFEEVDYWDELCTIMGFKRRNYPKNCSVSIRIRQSIPSRCSCAGLTMYSMCRIPVIQRLSVHRSKRFRS